MLSLPRKGKYERYTLNPLWGAVLNRYILGRSEYGYVDIQAFFNALSESFAKLPKYYKKLWFIDEKRHIVYPLIIQSLKAYSAPKKYENLKKWLLVVSVPSTLDDLFPAKGFVMRDFLLETDDKSFEIQPLIDSHHRNLTLQYFLLRIGQIFLIFSFITFIFPEIDYDKVDKIRGMDICISTSASDDESGEALLRAMKFPFKN